MTLHMRVVTLYLKYQTAQASALTQTPELCTLSPVIEKTLWDIE